MLSVVAVPGGAVEVDSVGDAVTFDVVVDDAGWDDGSGKWWYEWVDGGCG